MRSETREIASAIRETSGAIGKASHYAARSAGLTRESNYSGAKYLGGLLFILYNDFATWWDLNFSQSLVGRSLGIRGNMVRLAPTYDRELKVTGAHLATGITPAEVVLQAQSSPLSAGPNVWEFVPGVGTWFTAEQAAQAIGTFLW